MGGYCPLGINCLCHVAVLMPDIGRRSFLSYFFAYLCMNVHIECIVLSWASSKLCIHNSFDNNKRPYRVMLSANYSYVLDPYSLRYQQ